MQHIKDYWKESEVFHASNLNEIARTINELIDASEISVIEDEQISSGLTYSSAKIVEMIEGAGFHVAVVDELPAIGEHNTIYFVPSLDPKEKDVTDEFIWCDGKWEQIGSTRVDFSNYYTKGEIDDTVDVIEGMIAEKADVQHEHQMGDVNGLDEALAGKSDTGHTHVISDVSGLTETLEDFSEVISSHINEIEENINDIEDTLEEISFEELEYDEYALSTQESENIMAHGMVSKVGKTVTMQIYNANTKDGWGEICYRLPYAPDSTYVPVVNSRGMYESNGIHYKVSIEDRTVEVEPEVYVTYPALILVHYVNGSQASWEYGQNVIFKVDYITTE